ARRRRHRLSGRHDRREHRRRRGCGRDARSSAERARRRESRARRTRYSLAMRKRRSKWWWVAGIGITVLFVRWCSSSDERIEVVLHVKLAATAMPSVDDAKVESAEPLFDHHEAASTLDAWRR